MSTTPVTLLICAGVDRTRVRWKGVYFLHTEENGLYHIYAYDEGSSGIRKGPDSSTVGGYHRAYSADEGRLTFHSTWISMDENEWHFDSRPEVVFKYASESVDEEVWSTRSFDRIYEEII